ncbi:MAG: metalloregulator ArsR/SmtB family transcription factor [bacterium]
MAKKKICPLCFRLIGEGTRNKIIQQLRKKPNKAGKIEECFSLTQPTISHHLKVLEKAGMVFAKKKGREVYYFINKKYPCKKCSIFKIPLKA